MAKQSLKERRRRKSGKRSADEKLASALSVHQSGDLDAAERLYRQIIADDPLQGVALHHLGLIVQQRGGFDEAINLLERASASTPKDITVWTNLGNLYQESARSEDAVRAYRQAIVVAPNHVNALYNLGWLLIDTGDSVGAEQCFRDLVRIESEDAHVWHGLGITLEARGDKTQAEHAYRNALERQPTLSEVWYDLGNFLRLEGKLDKAQEALATAVRIEPRFAKAHNNLGGLYREMGDVQRAIACYRQSLLARPDHVETYQNLVSALISNDELEAATEVIERVIALNPTVSQAHISLGEIWFMREDFESSARGFRKAIEIDDSQAVAHNALGATLVRLVDSEGAEASCRRAIELDPQLAEAYGNLAAALKFQTRLSEAIEVLCTAVKLDPNNVEAFNDLGLAYVDAGDFEKADECYHKALEIAPDMPEALINIAMSRKYSAADKPAIVRLENQLGCERISHECRVALHFALGKVFDDCGEYAKAFEHYSKGNAAKAQKVSFDSEKHVASLGLLRDTFDRTLFSRLSSWGDASDLPVFIIGMPRSGTSLVEQILASHPQFHGAGELTHLWKMSRRLGSMLESTKPYPTCVRDMTQDVIRELANEYLSILRGHCGDAVRISDKMPYNYLHLGLIAVLFPNAKVIHCKRDPRDVCLSNFFQRYAVAHHYTYRLEDLVVYHREYERLMNHWRQNLPLVIHDVVYEELVDDLEGQSKALVESVNLEWDERCLQFNTTKRSVHTASHWQVRQPLYRSSSERWRRYQNDLGAFFKELAPPGPS